MANARTLIAEFKKHEKKIEKLTAKLPPDYQRITDELDWRMSRQEDIYDELIETKEGKKFVKQIEAKMEKTKKK